MTEQFPNPMVQGMDLTGMITGVPSGTATANGFSVENTTSAPVIQAPVSEPAPVPVPTAPAASAPEPEVAAPTAATETTEPTPFVPGSMFTMKHNYTTVGYAGYNSDEEETLSLPSGTFEETKAALQDTPNINPKNADAELQTYMETVTEGLSMLPYSMNYRGLFTRMGSDYRQILDSKGGPIASFAPKLKQNPGVKPTGESARDLVKNKLKLGNRWTVPLYHSGFTVTLTAPSDSELLELHEEIDREKALIGRHTYGNALSNNASYSSKIFMDFIAKHVLESSLSLPDGANLSNYILQPDLDRLKWGMACLVWPNGYQYSRACISNVETCKHVIRERLAIQRCDWVDSSALTDRQKNLLLKRERNSISLEEVKVYLADFNRGNPTSFDLPGGITVVFKVPTVAEHIEFGYRWISDIEDRFTSVLTKEPLDRDKYLMEQAQATAMRQYAHLVKCFVVDDIEIDGREDIEGILNDLTPVDATREAFITNALQFIEDSTISGVGIPTHTCPSCGGNQRPFDKKGNDAKYPEIIPLDISQLFFQLLLRRVLKIRQR